MTGKLEDGFKTLIEFSSNPTIKLYEIEVTPSGVDGGDAIPTSTMRNTAWRTQSPPKLKSATDGGATCAYETSVLPQIIAMVNVKQSIKFTFPDGETHTIWGWLKSFIPGALVEGSMPTAEVSIIPSNSNASGVEVAPVHALS